MKSLVIEAVPRKTGSGLRPVAIALCALGLAALACDGAALLGGGSAPTVTILSPAPGTSVPANQPVTVQAAAADPNGPGVFRVDLLVDGVSVNSFQAGGPQAALTANLTFTPAAEGAVAISVVAYREDGTASQPAMIALSVGGAAGGASSGGESSGGAPSGGQTLIRVEARANLEANIRQAPGPGCPIIGVWRQGETGFLLEVTIDPTEYWYKTDYLGPNLIGWVYHDPLALLGDDSTLPRVPSQGCLYCGDGVCSPEIDEVCDACVADCGVCPFCGDGEVNQDWEECDSGGCGAGYTCTAECACEAEPFCGDGVVNQPSEVCDGAAGCFEGSTCDTDCSQCLTVEPTGWCGDGICDEPDPCSCEEDCGVC